MDLTFEILKSFFDGPDHLTHEFGLYTHSEGFTSEEIAEIDAVHRYNREILLKRAPFWRKFFKERSTGKSELERSSYQSQILSIDERSISFAAKLTNFQSRYQGK